MRNLDNHHHLGEASFEGTAQTQVGFAMVDLGPYPGMIRGSGQVCGELYRVDAPTLAHLDIFEEHPNVYVRQSIALADGSIAQAYLLRSTYARGFPRVTSGDWRSYIRTQHKTPR